MQKSRYIIDTSEEENSLRDMLAESGIPLNELENRFMYTINEVMAEAYMMSRAAIMENNHNEFIGDIISSTFGNSLNINGVTTVTTLINEIIRYYTLAIIQYDIDGDELLVDSVKNTGTVISSFKYKRT